jgi:hypothetical protein
VLELANAVEDGFRERKIAFELHVLPSISKKEENRETLTGKSPFQFLSIRRNEIINK